STARRAARLAAAGRSLRLREVAVGEESTIEGRDGVATGGARLFPDDVVREVAASGVVRRKRAREIVRRIEDELLRAEQLTQNRDHLRLLHAVGGREHPDCFAHDDGGHEETLFAREGLFDE